MNFKLINRITGAIVFVFASIIYILTVQPTMSFWDCGEFLACAYTMGVPHPPGAPLHVLVGRIFTLLPTAGDIGLRMNYLSVFSSAFSVLLLYLVSVKVILNWKSKLDSTFDYISLAAASAIGALSYAFCDSFWFNAMEAEVYGFGTFLITLCIYTMMVWWERADEPGSDRLIVFFAFVVGLSLGIHLLVVQCVFIAGLMFYFRRYEYNRKSFLIAIGVSMAAFFVVYPIIVKKMPEAISSFPVVGFVIIIGLLVTGIVYSIKTKSSTLNLIFVSIFFVIIGYSTYISVLQRSSVSNIPLDNSNPDNMERLLSYLNREQYGEQPLLFPRRYLKDGMHDRTWKNYSSDMEFMWKYQINHMFNRYLFWQYIGRAGYDQDEGVDFSKFYAIPFILGLFGLFYHFRRDWKMAFVFLSMFILLGVVTALYQNQQDPQPRERDYFYEGAFYVYSLWIGLGVFGIIELLKEKLKASSLIPAASVVLLLAFVFVPANMIRVNYKHQNRAGNFFPFDYAYNLLQSCAKDAVLFTNGDNDTFPLWCLQAVYGIRQDVTLVNLSLAQADWYDIQLKNEKPYGSLPVPFTYTDDQIRKVTKQGYALWDENKLVSIDVPPSAYPDTAKSKPDKLVFKIPATIRQKDGNQTITALKSSDLIILDIIKGNKWERPIYFSVTVTPDNYIGLNDYIIVEGMAQRLTPMKVNNSNIFGLAVDFDKMSKNLLIDRSVVPSKTPQHGFMFRSLDNKDLFFDQVHERSIEMYRTLYLWLAGTMMEDSSKMEIAKNVLYKMEQNIPKEVTRLDYRQKYMIAMFFDRVGDKVKFNEYGTEAYNEAYSIRLSNKNNLSSYYNPYRIMLDILEARGDMKTSMDLLRELNPNDPAVKQKMDAINSRLNPVKIQEKTQDDKNQDKNP
ncbi:MAG: DUF2723 domain-containing protein [Ignavibacteriae bacterium]|nr:DUF2723 domain-containing protein [Ignavibacteriota bacterium]